MAWARALEWAGPLGVAGPHNPQTPETPMPRSTPPVRVAIGKDEDGNEHGVSMRRMFRELRDTARMKRKPEPSERPVIDAAEAKRERRRQRNLDRA